jgi:hypothetical protein
MKISSEEPKGPEEFECPEEIASDFTAADALSEIQQKTQQILLQVNPLP